MRNLSRLPYCAALAMATLTIGAAVSPATALARGATSAVQPAGAGAPPTCLIHSLPSFIAQGEFATTATVADVIEVECNPYVYGTGATVTITAAQLASRCAEITWYVPDEPGGNGNGELAADAGFVSKAGASVQLHLDGDGNANVALIAGPHCMVGESLVTLDEDESPYETFVTSFKVLPAESTPEGLYATPSSQVEDAASSGVVTVVQAEFSGASEAKVRVGAQQLYDRCQRGPHLIWVRENRELVVGPELAGEHAIELDNDGNGFALAVGSDSCAEGSSLIEGDLERSPYTTLTAEFAVLPPQPTEEPSFTIVKSQEIKGSGTGFTSAPLTANEGETVDYQIAVTNTGHVKETFTSFSDAHCDPGTISGGPGAAPVGPGETAIFTCRHVLMTVGTYTNEATITGNTVSGRPVVETSNQVVVKVAPHVAVVREPAFTIEKLQRIGSSASFTTATLTAAAGSTIEYEIIVRNTGNVSLKLSGFSDANCDPGTISGGPGAGELMPGSSSTFTCTRVLGGAGTYVNAATVTGAGTAPGEMPMTITSNKVETVVPSNSVGAKEERPKQGLAPACESNIHPVLHGASGLQTGRFTVWVSSSGIARISFYLDGHRIRSFTRSQARGGRFKLTLNAHTLRYGVHHLSITAAPINVNCASAASSRTVFRPRPNLGVRFTG